LCLVTLFVGIVTLHPIPSSNSLIVDSAPLSSGLTYVSVSPPHNVAPFFSRLPPPLLRTEPFFLNLCRTLAFLASSGYAFPDDSLAILTSRACQAFELCDTLHGEADARAWAKGFQWDPAVRLRDDALAAECNNSLVAMVEKLHTTHRQARLSPERVHACVHPNAPDAAKIRDLAATGMRVLTHPAFVPNGQPPSALRSRYQRVAPAVNKLVQEAWESQLVFILTKERAMMLQERLHFSPMHWTTKAFKPQGRQLIDSSDASGGWPLNSDEARELLESFYGTIHHVTLDEIIDYILQYQSIVQFADPDDELILYKGDLKGAFTLLNVRASDVSLFASELTDDLVLIYPTGSFGWTGTPFCFQVVTRQLVHTLRDRVRGIVWAYVDDFMGICRRSDLAYNVDTVRIACTELLGPEAMAEDKWDFGRKLDMIGWSICLDSQRVGISERNAFKVLYGFFHVDVDSVTSKVSRDLLHRLAAWSARYTQILRQAAPLTSVLFGQVHSTTCNMVTLSPTTRSAILLWRVLLCLMEMDATTYTRSLQSFHPHTPTVELHFDASLEGLGIFLVDYSLPQPVFAAAQVSVNYLQLHKQSQFQNSMEFLALTIGVIVLARKQYRDCTIRAIGDSTAALKWAGSERFTGLRGTRIAMIFMAVCTRFGFMVPETRHIPGDTNVICDDLSRNATTVPEVFPHLQNEADLDSDLIAELISMADPRDKGLLNQPFEQLWVQVQTVLTRI
jgi:hypothetical protein